VIASSQRAGRPIRIALAIVSGSATGCPVTSGAAPLGLEAEHARRRAALAKALPVGGDVAGVADRNAQRIQLPQLVEQFEGGGLLALEAKLVDGVDERDRMAIDEFAHERERLVEVAAQRDDARAVDQRLASLPVAILPSGTITPAVRPARAA